jgi:hypothetical protein
MLGAKSRTDQTIHRPSSAAVYTHQWCVKRQEKAGHPVGRRKRPVRPAQSREKLVVTSDMSVSQYAGTQPPTFLRWNILNQTNTVTILLPPSKVHPAYKVTPERG